MEFIYDKEQLSMYNISFGIIKNFKDEFKWRKHGGVLVGENNDYTLALTYFSDATNHVYYTDIKCTRFKK